MEAFEEERRLIAEIEAMEGEVASYENEVSHRVSRHQGGQVGAVPGVVR